MIRSRWKLVFYIIALSHAFILSARAADDPPARVAGQSKLAPNPTRGSHATSVETLAALAKPSVVVISQFGRNGEIEALGSGFVISSNGMIATSLHVIGEAREFRVEFSNGKSFPIQQIRAWDRKLDLAIIQVDATNLPALALGDSDSIRQGREVVAMGHPRGFEHSVVQGVVSAIREFESFPMIQLAMPIEPGNSGGPLLDMEGKVQGILTMKSVLSDNLGFAMPVNALKLLLEKPNPVPIDRWLALGALDPKEWSPRLGARWTQRAGRIQVDGLGTGFGGRSLCLSQRPVPEPPYEIQVRVRLDDESGAAGLVFGAETGEKHFGFYPTAGQLRLTRFDGPTVFSWSILQQVKSSAYHAGDWNTLKIRVETNRLLCFVNGQLAIETTSLPKIKGKAGLAKFRQTKATFKDFQIAKTIAAPVPPADVASIAKKIEELAHGDFDDQTWLEAIQDHAGVGRSLLLTEAKKFEEKSLRLRKLAAEVHFKHMQDQLLKTLSQPDPEVDLFRAALLIAKMDNEDLDLAAYQRELDQMARALAATLPPSATEAQKLDALNDYLFVQNGFHGSRADFYNPANSYLNQVIDDREGIPITLSILYLELGRRIGLTDLAGLSLPYRFMVAYHPAHGPARLIDVFDAGKSITEAEFDEWSSAHSGSSLTAAALKPATKKEIVLRMLRNLIEIALESADPSQALHYLDASIALDPDDPLSRLRRGSIRYKTGNLPGAKDDFRWVLQKRPTGLNLDLDQLEQLFRSL